MINIYDVIKCNKKHPSPNDDRFVVIYLDIVNNEEFNVVHYVNLNDIHTYIDSNTDIVDKIKLQKSDYLDRYELDVNYYRNKKINKLLNGVQ